MKNRILLAATLLLSTLSFAQVRPIQGKQLETATAQDQVMTSGPDLKARWSPAGTFLKWNDTTLTLATLTDLAVVDQKHIATGVITGENLILSRVNGGTVTIGLSGTWIPLSQKGAVNGVVPLNASSKIDAAYLPAMPAFDFFSVASQAAMLALSTATPGDHALRTDQSKVYVLNGSDPSILCNWVELPTGGGIVSINGKTGTTVTVTTDDIGEGSVNQYFSVARARTSMLGSSSVSYNNSTGVVSLPATGVTAGTYNTVTINANGVVTAATNNSYVTPTDLNNYYTKTQLQTAGQAMVSYLNLVDVPSTVAINLDKQQSTGSTSSTITLNHTPKFGNDTPVFLNGVLLHAADYSISGTTLTIGTGRTNADVVTILNFY